MARLIDADAAKLTANDYKIFRCQLGGLVDVVEFLEDMPKVDAVPVVRCKDCIHHTDEEPGMVYCPAVIGGWVSNDFFCGDGEREENDE